MFVIVKGKTMGKSGIAPTDHFQKSVTVWREAINRKLEYSINSSKLPLEIDRAIRHTTLGSQCHRWRSILLLCVSDILQLPFDPSLLAACSIESLHNATLILDDLNCWDAAEYRRGKPTAHKMFGESNAISAAIWLMGMSRTYMEEAKNTFLLKGYNFPVDQNDLQQLENCLQHGQYDDKNITNTPDEIARNKSGVFFAFSAYIPARVIDSHLETLYTYGENVGIAYQAMDDLDDVLGDPSEMGKSICMDVGKNTFVNVYGIERTKEIAKEYMSLAIQALTPLDNTIVSVRLLHIFAQAVTYRNYFDLYEQSMIELG
jgi:geranylgeranyl diphosphate synthase, type II